MNTNNNKLLKRVFNLFTTREKEIINHPADKDFEYKIEEIQKQININLQNLQDIYWFFWLCNRKLFWK